ncbi:uncharacterized protein ASCRUDRAFT_77411 [Ascoidea rubescens DSM 1968]|uniref:Alcohol acetyltransferase n=1 Tax=Ascoidea rubescens DSM 1968 TaxID=1344418 RepID=A0A1D2VBC5_9ASCO|nr:hypothetical protein ASCRUDRAFT_77411 [Ascoidea rubescens DSM 1968]ODV58994.1 hypothetical protein ASCRUDRAFT_77411 [Ascoidea rubescens DSM 1968]
MDTQNLITFDEDYLNLASNFTRPIDFYEDFYYIRNNMNLYNNTVCTANFSNKIRYPLLVKVLRQCFLDNSALVLTVVKSLKINENQPSFAPLKLIRLKDVVDIKFSSINHINDQLLAEVDKTFFDFNNRTPLFKLYLLNNFHHLICAGNHIIFDGGSHLLLFREILTNLIKFDADSLNSTNSQKNSDSNPNTKSSSDPSSDSDFDFNSYKDEILFDLSNDHIFLKNMPLGLDTAIEDCNSPIFFAVKDLFKYFAPKNLRDYKIFGGPVPNSWTGYTLAQPVPKNQIIFKLKRLDPKVVETIKINCRKNSVTITPFIEIAFYLILNKHLQSNIKSGIVKKDDIGYHYDSFRTFLAMDARRFYMNKNLVQNPDNAWGCYALQVDYLVQTDQFIKNDNKFNWDYVKQSNDKVREICKGRDPVNHMAIMKFTKRENVFKTGLGRPRESTLQISNVGLVDFDKYITSTALKNDNNWRIDDMAGSQSLGSTRCNLKLSIITTKDSGMCLQFSAIRDDKISYENIIEECVDFLKSEKYCV